MRAFHVVKSGTLALAVITAIRSKPAPAQPHRDLYPGAAGLYLLPSAVVRGTAARHGGRRIGAISN